MIDPSARSVHDRAQAFFLQPVNRAVLLFVQ